MSTRTIEVAIKRLPHGLGLALPRYETKQSAGMDLPAAIEEMETVEILPGQSRMIPTGFAMSLPSGFEAQIRPRSGLAAKHGMSVLNTPGTIDADYRGEVKVILVNHGEQPFTVERGMRIAQMVIAPITQASWLEVQELVETERGAGGFGSTGVAEKES